MLIDSFSPNPDATEVHRLVIDGLPEEVYRVLWTADLGDSVIIKALLALRSMPEIVLHPRRSWRRGRKITLHTLVDSGFGLLAEEPGKEIVLGITGRFWRPTGNLAPFNRENFDRPVRPGFAQAVWNFAVEDGGAGRTVLSTETRITCGDASSRRKFLAYWSLVRPFSGLIRRLMLRSVERAVSSR